jgi:antitoxin YefM
MDAVSYSDLRQNLKAYMDRVFHDHETLIITRKNDENVVLLSIEDYNSIMETHYLLSSEVNAKHLTDSIQQYKSGIVHERDLIDHD